MGGRQKRLTVTRRKELTKTMTEALVAGQFALQPGQSLDSVLDEVDDGIRNDRYPIDVDLPGLLAIWSGTPAPVEAQTAAGSEQGAPPAAEEEIPGSAAAMGLADAILGAGPAVVPGTVEHAQAQAAAASNGASPTAQAILGTGPAIGTGNAIQGGHPAYSSAQQANVMLNPDGSAMHPLPGPAAAPGPAPMTEVGAPAAAIAPKEEKAPVVDIDLDAVRGWIQIARGAQRKIDASKDVLDQAMSQVNDFLDQQGGPDVSKKGLLDGEHAVQRTFCRRKVFNKTALLADHPEIPEEQYTEKTPYYRTELK